MITIKRTFCPGRGMIRPEELTGYVFSPEAAAHMFIITKMEKVDGQEAAVPFDAGTDISCRFIKANGVTELVDGDLTDDGAASITLPAECYQVPGRFILSIYAETSEETICIYSATATALAGDTEEINVSGNTKRTIDAQIAALNDAVENAQETVEQVQEVIDSIPQDYTALSNSVSDLKSNTNNSLEAVLANDSFSLANGAVKATGGSAVTWGSGQVSTTGSSGSSSDGSRYRTDGIVFAFSGRYLFTVKSGYKMLMNEYNGPASSTYLSRNVWNFSTGSNLEVYINSAYTYRLCVGKTDDSTLDNDSPNVPADVLTWTAVHTDTTLSGANKAADGKTVGDRFNAIYHRMSEDSLIWTDFADATHTKGWEKGSWTDAGGTSEGSGNAMKLIVRLPLAGIASYKVDFTGDYTFTVKTWSAGSLTTIAHRYDCHSGDEITFADGDDYAGIQMTGFGTASQTYIDNDYPATVVVKRRYQVNSPFKANDQEYIHFNITNDVSWGAIGVGTASNVETQNPVSTKCVLTLPDSYNPVGKPVPMIMYCHGASGHVSDTQWYQNSSYFINMIKAFRNAGFAVFDVDNTRGDTDGFYDWGCLPLMQSYVKAWEYIKANYNVRHDLYLVSCSMGTTTALNMIKWYGSRIVTSVQVAPRPICKHRYATATDIHKKQLLCAFGIEPDSILEDSSFTIPDDTVFTDDYAGFWHYENIIEVNNRSVLPGIVTPPIKVLVGAEDPEFLTETRAYYEALRNSGNYVDYREVTGATHDLCFTTHYTGVTDEVINWLKRFK